jgi:hypothetical protein
MNIPTDTFTPLRDELCRWQDDLQDCTLWWRDDDLISDSSGLRKMQQLSEEYDVPALVAVIPATVDSALGSDTANMPTLIFCQHGHAHRSFAATGQSNSEFPATRPVAEIEEAVRSGQNTLEEVFGERFFPVFVPPWNAYREDLVPALASWGYTGLSQYGSRAEGMTNGVLRVNTHIDLVDWATAPEFQPGRAETLIEHLTDLLMKKRRKEIDPTKPIGILTHHRAMRDDAWDFFSGLLKLTSELPVVRWLSPHDVFSRD